MKDLNSLKKIIKKKFIILSILIIKIILIIINIKTYKLIFICTKNDKITDISTFQVFLFLF
jgi:hypothetical protein